MFPSEKQLVEKLVEELQMKYDTKYIVRELRGGNNIADIVYTPDINRDKVVFDEYLNAYYYFQEIYNKKRVNLNNISIRDKNTNKKFCDFLHELEDMGYVKVNDSYVETIKKVDSVTKNFVAIEAKISDWKSGLEQANRYKQFANEVYVAIDAEYLCKVDKSIFKEMNIGLISVSNDKMRVVIKAKKKRVKQLDIQYYIMDKFLKQFHNTVEC
ncbi:hypothetical protein [Clostridium sp.]|uniref:hypothetical protein n=1 Tax=Clostridium sp. TaxID=1506 RepID=UPI00290E1B15|nr:hypothetical protein [Clostridium sp.]MDU4724840.1 hypothetical protein [Clostridium sp.]